MAFNPFITYLFNLSDECTALAAELKQVLAEERTALIALKTEEILLQVSKKESLMLKIVRKRAELKKFLRTQFQSESSEALVLSDAAATDEWRAKVKLWEKVWDEVRVTCESNQRFITHSMKNLSLLVDNLKRLFGQHATYSAKGKRVDSGSQGKVVEGRY